MSNINKEEKALKAKEARIAKECTFKPDIKERIKYVSHDPVVGRASTGSINLANIAKRKGGDMPEDPFGEPAKKYD